METAATTCTQVSTRRPIRWQTSWCLSCTQPLAAGGAGLDPIDLVLSASGLDAFGEKYARARQYELDGVRVTVLPLERVIASKVAANPPKDAAQMPILRATLAAPQARAKDPTSCVAALA